VSDVDDGVASDAAPAQHWRSEVERVPIDCGFLPAEANAVAVKRGPAVLLSKGMGLRAGNKPMVSFGPIWVPRRLPAVSRAEPRRRRVHGRREGRRRRCIRPPAEAVHAGRPAEEGRMAEPARQQGPERAEARRTWEPAQSNRGLECRSWGCKHFRVIYARPAWGRRVVRRRGCRHCGREMTTWEHDGL